MYIVRRMESGHVYFDVEIRLNTIKISIEHVH